MRQHTEAKAPLFSLFPYERNVLVYHGKLSSLPQNTKEGKTAAGFFFLDQKVLFGRSTGEWTDFFFFSKMLRKKHCSRDKKASKNTDTLTHISPTSTPTSFFRNRHLITIGRPLRVGVGGWGWGVKTGHSFRGRFIYAGK